MSDDHSLHSAMLDDMEEAQFEGDSDYDESSAASEESEMSAPRLVTHPEYAVIWELLHACQEAAFSDIPERYSDCLSVFDAKHSASESEPVALQRDEKDSQYDELFRAAGATNTLSEPWSLPAIARPLSMEDALWPPNKRVLDVSQVTPTAAVYLTPDITLADLTKEFERTAGVVTPMAITDETRKTLESSASPLVYATTPLFASVVFASASQISHHERPSFLTLRRYNRLATTSLLRQAHSFHIDTPVFGILLQGNLVAFHVDWYEEKDSMVVSNSAFYPLDDEEADAKTWDLRQPAEALEVVTILTNLRKYTSGPYASRVHKGLETVKGPIKPWKRDTSRLPEALIYTQLEQQPEEPVENKMNRWLQATETSMDHEMRGASLRRKWDAERLAFSDFLSPPSTPQSPEKQHTAS